MSKVGVVVIHGQGSAPDSYVAQFIRRINRWLDVNGGRAQDVVWGPVKWADLMKPRQDQYFEAVSAERNFEHLPVRRFIAAALGDASAYLQSRPGEGGSYDQIHGRVDEVVTAVSAKLGDPGAPLVVMGFSLGSLIASNYIWDVQNLKHPHDRRDELGSLAGLITFGSSIPLLTFGREHVTPISFPGDRLDAATRRKARWLNFYGRSDVLGYPLRSINAAYARVVTEDREIDVGGLELDRPRVHGSDLSSWTPAAHTRYWASPDFTDPVAAFLKSLLA